MKYNEFLHMLVDEIFLIKSSLDALNYSADLRINADSCIVYIHDHNKNAEIVDYLHIYPSEVENADKQREAMALLDKYLPF